MSIRNTEHNRSKIRAQYASIIGKLKRNGLEPNYAILVIKNKIAYELWHNNVDH